MSILDNKKFTAVVDKIKDFFLDNKKPLIIFGVGVLVGAVVF